MFEYKLDNDYIVFTDEELTTDELCELRKHKSLALAMFKAKLGVTKIELSTPSKALHMTPKVEPKCTCHLHDLAYYGCRCKLNRYISN